MPSQSELSDEELRYLAAFVKKPNETKLPEAVAKRLVELGTLDRADAPSGFTAPTVARVVLDEARKAGRFASIKADR